MIDVIDRIIHGQCTRAVFAANSFLLSVDGAHAYHPNYKDRYEDAHCALMHKGPVLKYNTNKRYATNGISAAVIKQIAKQHQIPIQEFVVRNDSPCGSTIGPIISALSGIQTADIGNPMLSMHSVREMCGTSDISYLCRLLKAFWS
uniref:aspartyl aminopeptidase n=1 Tax=Lygus hesperus TaxID=30085 RepID=A0A0A9Y1J7_LYGHE